MATKLRELLGSALTSLRYEPTEERLRICLDGGPVADTVDGLLVWKPRRLVPTYAVPESDVAARLESAGRVDDLADESVLVPTDPFTVDYVAFFNERVDIVVDGQHRERPVTHWSD
jgi:hypothetical protein